MVQLVVPPDSTIGISASSGDGQITLSWDDPNDSSIIKHQVSQDGGSWMDIPDSAHGGFNVASHTVGGLINGSNYTFAVRAVNAIGRGLTSAGVTKEPLAATENTAYVSKDSTLYTLKGPTQVSWGERVVYKHPTGAPQARLAVMVATGKMLAELGADCSGCIAFLSEESASSDHRVFTSSDAKDWAGYHYSAIISGEEKLFVTVPWGVQSDIGTTFDVGLASKDSWAWGTEPSDGPSHFSVTIKGNPPAMPSGLSAAAGNGEVSLSWNDPGNKSITGYQYRQSTDGGETWEVGWTAISGGSAGTIGHTVRSPDERSRIHFRRPNCEHRG